MDGEIYIPYILGVFSSFSSPVLTKGVKPLRALPTVCHPWTRHLREGGFVVAINLLSPKEVTTTLRSMQSTRARLRLHLGHLVLYICTTVHRKW